MSCPVMGETIVLPPGTLPDSIFKVKSKEPEPERRKALEEMVVPLTLAFSRDRTDANFAEDLVIAYRNFEGSVRHALRYAVRTGNLEALCLLLNYDTSFYEFRDDQFIQELVEEACKANRWECVSLLMRYSRKGIKVVPDVEEVQATADTDKKTLGDGFQVWLKSQVRLITVFTLLYGLLLVSNAKGTPIPPNALQWIKLGGNKIPTQLPNILAQAFYMAVAVGSMLGLNGLGIALEGPLTLLLVALQVILTVSATANAGLAALSDAVWTQRSSHRTVRVPSYVDPKTLIDKKETEEEKDKAKAAEGKGTDPADAAAAIPGHPGISGADGAKCPFHNMWAKDE